MHLDDKKMSIHAKYNWKGQPVAYIKNLTALLYKYDSYKKTSSVVDWGYSGTNPYQ